MEKVVTEPSSGKPSFGKWLLSLLKDYGAIVAILAIGIPGLISVGGVKERLKDVPKLSKSVGQIQVSLATLSTRSDEMVKKLGALTAEVRGWRSEIAANRETLSRIDERAEQQGNLLKRVLDKLLPSP